MFQDAEIQKTYTFNYLYPIVFEYQSYLRRHLKIILHCLHIFYFNISSVSNSYQCPQHCSRPLTCLVYHTALPFYTCETNFVTFCLVLCIPSLAITKTCPYNFDPLKPHFYIVILGFTGVYIIVLFLRKT